MSFYDDVDQEARHGWLEFRDSEPPEEVPDEYELTLDGQVYGYFTAAEVEEIQATAIVKYEVRKAT